MATPPLVLCNLVSFMKLKLGGVRTLHCYLAPTKLGVLDGVPRSRVDVSALEVDEAKEVQGCGGGNEVERSM